MNHDHPSLTKDFFNTLSHKRKSPPTQPGLNPDIAKIADQPVRSYPAGG